MKDGYWIGIAQAFKDDLPNDRPYTELESAFSVQLDDWFENEVTISGYASQWSWSRKKVRAFLNRIGVEIIYPEDTAKTRNQRGHIRVHKRDIKGTYKGHKRLIDYRELQTEGDIKGTYKGHKGDIKGNATIKDKEKEKEKKRKEEVSEKKIKYAEFVSMTQKQYDQLTEKHGKDFVENMIERLNNYKGSTGKKYKSDYHTALSWIAKDKKEEQPVFEIPKGGYML